MITLTTLPEASLQEIFDQAATHLLTQNKIAGTKGNCMYRAADGSKCAVGCFISDNEYDPVIEGEAFDSVLFFEYTQNLSYEKKSLFQRLQYIHDSGHVDSWKDELRELAAKYKLNTDAISSLNT